MTGIVHHQCTIGHLLLDQSRHIREAVARRRGSTLVGIPVDLLHVIAGIGILDESGHAVGRRHVRVVVAVITHHTDSILPGTRILIISVADGLVHEHLCLFERAGRETSHGDIRLTQIRLTGSALFNPLSIVEQAIEIVAHVTIDMAE